jgi:hypothetical protein
VRGALVHAGEIGQTTPTTETDQKAGEDQRGPPMWRIWKRALGCALRLLICPWSRAGGEDGGGTLPFSQHSTLRDVALQKFPAGVLEYAFLSAGLATQRRVFASLRKVRLPSLRVSSPASLVSAFSVSPSQSRRPRSYLAFTGIVLKARRGGGHRCTHCRTTLSLSPRNCLLFYDA